MEDVKENAVAMSNEINELAGAMAKAQVEIKNAVKDSLNPYYNRRYADLATVWDACRGPLSNHGLAVIQTTDSLADQIVIYTTLAHSSGQWIRGKLVMKPIAVRVSKEDATFYVTPQVIGSCLTYGRRYALAAIVGVAPEDDDGNQASAKEDGPAPGKGNKPEIVKPTKFKPRDTKQINQANAEGKLTPVNKEAAKDIAVKKEVKQIPKELKTLMELSGVNEDALQAYLQFKEFIPKEGEISDLPEETFKQMIEDDNWTAVVKRIKEAK